MLSRLAALCAVTVSCAGASSLSPRGDSSDELAWLAPTAAKDLQTLDRWRRAVGPAYVTRTDTGPALASRLLVVSWNTAVGSADVV